MFTLRWETEHIPFDDMRGQPFEVIMRASNHNMKKNSGHVYIKNDLRPEDVAAARAKATFWLLPTGMYRPVPLGKVCSKQDMAHILKAIRLVSKEETANTGQDIVYHFDEDAPETMEQNIHSQLISSTLFDIPVVVEFK